jgi:hypothetical protein
MDTPNGGQHPVSSAERRDWDRLPITIPFFVRGRNYSGEEFLQFAATLNLSAGGALLATKRYCEPSTPISLEVPIASATKVQLQDRVWTVEATVLRCTPERHYYLLGLQFERPMIAASGESGNDSSAANPSE